MQTPSEINKTGETLTPIKFASSQAWAKAGPRPNQMDRRFSESPPNLPLSSFNKTTPTVFGLSSSKGGRGAAAGA